MKTKNNVQKTTLAATIIFIGILIAGIVSASETDRWNTNGLKSTTAFETAIDEKLEIETWMTYENYFSAGYGFEAASERPLEIENWMISENSFIARTLPEPATDKILGIETWMIDDGIFSQAFKLIEPVPDRILTVEDWMLKNKYW